MRGQNEQKGLNLLKILSASDIHLDTFSDFALPVSNPVSNSRLENILQALDYFFEMGIKQKIITYVINGDTFNNRSKMNPNFYFYCVKRIVSKFRKVPEGSTLYFNVGNHSEMGRFIEPNSDQIFESFSTPNHKIVVPNKESNIYTLEDNTNIMLVPFTEDVATSKKAIRQDIETIEANKQPTTVFAHLGVDGASSGRWPSHKLGGAYNLADLGMASEYIYNITCGHYHTRSVLGTKKYKTHTTTAWYQGDLTELNFNDVSEDGTGAPRGFDIIDTATGEHEFYDISNNFPKFEIFDLADTKYSLEDIEKSMLHNYVKLVVHDKETYQQITKAYKEARNPDSPVASIQLVLPPKEDEGFKVSSVDTNAETLSKYMQQFYPSDKSLNELAQQYLSKAESTTTD